MHLITFAATLEGIWMTLQRLCTHRLRHGLPGYLILFATHSFRTSASVIETSEPPSPVGILSNIYEFHLYTRNSAFLYRYSRLKSFDGSSRVKLWDFTTNFFNPPTNSLSPVIPNYARSLRITAAAGTELAGVSSTATVIIFTVERALRP